MSDTIRNDPVLSLIRETLRLLSRFDSLFGEARDETSLSTLQKLVLYSIFEAPAPPTVPQVGRNLGHPRQVIQKVVNELVEAGILDVAANPHHKRAKLLIPTAKAQGMKHKAETRAAEIAASVLDKISAKRCATVTQELQSLREEIDLHLALEVERPPTNDEVMSSIAALVYLERHSQK